MTPNNFGEKAQDGKIIWMWNKEYLSWDIINVCVSSFRVKQSVCY